MQKFMEKLKDIPVILINFFLAPMSHLKNFPQSTRQGVLFMYAGWAWFLSTLYIINLSEVDISQIFGRMLIIGILTCFFVTKGYNWARLLCVIFSGIIIAGCAVFTITLWLSFYSGLIAVNVVIFGYSTYYLLKKETSDYFTSLAKDKEEKKK